jgi:hypothetical protein
LLQHGHGRTQRGRSVQCAPLARRAFLQRPAAGLLTELIELVDLIGSGLITETLEWLDLGWTTRSRARLAPGLAGGTGLLLLLGARGFALILGLTLIATLWLFTALAPRLGLGQTLLTPLLFLGARASRLASALFAPGLLAWTLIGRTGLPFRAFVPIARLASLAGGLVRRFRARLLLAGARLIIPLRLART